MPDRHLPFWNRTKYSFVNYSGIVQTGGTCVFASVAGAINYLCGRKIWDYKKLEIVQFAVGKAADFSVIDVAIYPVQSEIKAFQYTVAQPGFVNPLQINKLRDWIDRKAIVILSVEEATKTDSNFTRTQNWHMFTVISRDSDRFQIWDTNNHKGYLTESELTSGFEYLNRNWFLPHDNADCLVIEKV